MYYLNARMYDPVTARFLQEDSYRGSINDPLSLNLYTYCHNEPIMYYDPSGHWRVLNNLWEGTKNVASKTAEWTKVQKDYFVEGLDILTDATKRREAFELIDTYGSESDKIMSRVYAGTAVVAGTGIVAATAVYSAPLLATGAMKIAVASPLAGTLMMKGDKLLYGTLGVAGGSASLVDNIKNEEYGKAVVDLAMIGLGAYTLGSVVREYNATNAYINATPKQTPNPTFKPSLQLFGEKGTSRYTLNTSHKGTFNLKGVGGSGANNIAQYPKLKLDLATEEIQSVINTTKHGAERLMNRGFTPSEISNLKISPTEIMTQGDGARVYIKEIASAKFNVIVESNNGVVTALKNIGKNSLDRLAKNYGWR